MISGMAECGICLSGTALDALSAKVAASMIFSNGASDFPSTQLGGMCQAADVSKRAARVTGWNADSYLRHRPFGRTRILTIGDTGPLQSIHRVCVSASLSAR